MVNQETITDVRGIFEKTGKPSSSLLNRLTVRGREEKVSLSLRKYFGWKGTDPAVVVVHSVDADSGRIRDSGYITLGERTLYFMATDLWEDAAKELGVEVEVRDFAEFHFTRNCHFSQWIDSDNMDVTVYKGEKKETLSPEEIEEQGITRFCLRLCLTPTCVGVATAMMGALPMALGEALEKYPRLNEGRCPQVNLPMKGRMKGAPFDFIPAESPKDGVGIGVILARRCYINLSGGTQ